MEKMKKYYTITVAFFLFLTFGFFIIGKSSAQNLPSTIGMSISPPTFEITGTKGSILQEVIKFENPNNFPLSIVTSVKNFTAQGEEGAVDLTTNDTPFSLASWISVSPTSVVVPARSSFNFNYTITIPKDAEPGGHFGSIVFSTKPSATTNKSGAVVTQELGDLILLKIPGATNISWNIASFNSASNVYWANPLKFILRIKDTGDVHIQPTGRIELTNVFGQTITEPIPSLDVLPSAIRRSTTLFYPSFLLGFYKAKVFVNVSGGEKTASLTFWAFPGKQLIIFSIILTVILVVGFLGRKRFKKALLILIGKE